MEDGESPADLVSRSSGAGEEGRQIPLGLVDEEGRPFPPGLADEGGQPRARLAAGCGTEVGCNFLGRPRLSAKPGGKDRPSSSARPSSPAPAERRHGPAGPAYQGSIVTPFWPPFGRRKKIPLKIVNLYQFQLRTGSQELSSVRFP